MEGLEQAIEDIRAGIQAGHFTTTEEIKLGIVLRLLTALSWPIYEPQHVAPGYTWRGSSVDYALLSAGRPRVLLQVQLNGRSAGKLQLVDEARQQDSPMAVCTDGRKWQFFLLSDLTPEQEHCSCTIDIVTGTSTECVQQLRRYLDRTAVDSGAAIKAIEEDCAVAAVLPRAWQELVEKRDTLLLDLMAEQVKDMCGYKPSAEVVARFLQERLRLIDPDPRAQVKHKVDVPTVPREPGPYKLHTLEYPHRRVDVPTVPRESGPYRVTFLGHVYPCRWACDALECVFRLCGEHDGTFFERFSQLEHGTRRRYLARDPYELYPDRPDFIDQRRGFREVGPGWYILTYLSKKAILRIIRMACECAGLRYGSDVQVDLGNGEA